MHVGGVDGMTPTDAILANLRRKERLYRADGCTATADDYAATVALIEGMQAAKSTWNFDIEQAPRGSMRKRTIRPVGKTPFEIEEHQPDLIIAAGNGGVVTVSKWLPKEGRWTMLTKAVPPLAWQPFPTHPHAEKDA
jgi:hypothetical protein